MDLEKVMAILEWSLLRNLYDVHAFLEFTNFYQQFILSYSNMIALLVGLIKKGVCFK